MVDIGLRDPDFPIMIRCRQCGCLFNNHDEECPMCGLKVKFLGAVSGQRVLRP